MAREVCVVGGGAIEDFWNSAIAKSYVFWFQLRPIELNVNKGWRKTWPLRRYLHRSCQQQETNNEVNLVENATVGIEKLISGTCSFFLLAGGTAEDFTNGPFCGEIQTTGKPFFTSGGSFLLPKGSPLSLEFGNATLALKKRGALRTLEQYFEDRGLCSVNDPIVITFSRLRLFFILAYCAGFFMFLVIIFDRLQPKKIETKSTGDLQANGPTERVNDGVPVGVKPVGEVESDASSATDMVWSAYRWVWNENFSSRFESKVLFFKSLTWRWTMYVQYICTSIFMFLKAKNIWGSYNGSMLFVLWYSHIHSAPPRQTISS